MRKLYKPNSITELLEFIMEEKYIFVTDINEKEFFTMLFEEDNILGQLISFIQDNDVEIKNNKTTYDINLNLYRIPRLEKEEFRDMIPSKLLNYCKNIAQLNRKINES